MVLSRVACERPRAESCVVAVSRETRRRPIGQCEVYLIRPRAQNKTVVGISELHILTLPRWRRAHTRGNSERNYLSYKHLR